MVVDAGNLRIKLMMMTLVKVINWFSYVVKLNLDLGKKLPQKMPPGKMISRKIPPKKKATQEGSHPFEHSIL